MKKMGCDDNEGFIRATHAATINDTFWIKSDLENLTWEQISLYRNPFTDTISRLAFEGVGLYAGDFSSTSPELSCEGSFRKCFRKEKQRGSFGSDIFIYKRGNDLGPVRDVAPVQDPVRELLRLAEPSLRFQFSDLRQIVIVRQFLSFLHERLLGTVPQPAASEKKADEAGKSLSDAFQHDCVSHERTMARIPKARNQAPRRIRTAVVQIAIFPRRRGVGGLPKSGLKASMAVLPRRLQR